MAKEFKDFLFDVTDHIATLTFNRPEQMNTLTVGVMLEFVEAIDLVDADDDIRVLIITGAGRAFCAGADLASRGADAFNYASQGAVRDKLKVNDIYRDWGGWMALRLFHCNKPIIAAVNGAAAGIGATLLTSMDIRVASTASKFVFPFARRGIVPEACSTWFLPRLVGLPAALEWCLTGRQIPATEALHRGFVTSLHEPDDLIAAARAIAQQIVDHTAPISIALTRQMLWRMAGASHPMEAHRAESRAVQMRGTTPDVKEGINSFMEKRLPNFPGKVSEGLPDVFPDWIEPEFT